MLSTAGKLSARGCEQPPLRSVELDVSRIITAWEHVSMSARCVHRRRAHVLCVDNVHTRSWWAMRYGGQITGGAQIELIGRQSLHRPWCTRTGITWILTAPQVPQALNQHAAWHGDSTRVCQSHPPNRGLDPQCSHCRMTLQRFGHDLCNRWAQHRLRAGRRRY